MAKPMMEMTNTRQEQRDAAMISTPTVLILGAGSSEHVGYPLGAGLVSDLCKLRTAKLHISLPEDWTHEELMEFLMRLGRSAHYSVDAFLETAREYVPIGKFLMARRLKQLENLDRLFPPHNSGWYQYLFNRLLVNGKPDFEKNKIGIVTFNYDRSLEAYLHTVLQNRFKMSEEDASELLRQIPIIHVHGILGKYPDTPYRSSDSNDELKSIAEQIHIVHEIEDVPDGFCNEAFARANEILQSAECIFFLGFGFHLDNVRRFRFFNSENMKDRLVRSTYAGMQPFELEQLLERLADHGFTKKVFGNRGIGVDSFFGHTASLI